MIARNDTSGYDWPPKPMVWVDVMESYWLCALSRWNVHQYIMITQLQTYSWWRQDGTSRVQSRYNSKVISCTQRCDVYQPCYCRISHWNVNQATKTTDAQSCYQPEFVTLVGQLSTSITAQHPHYNLRCRVITTVLLSSFFDKHRQ